MVRSGGGRSATISMLVDPLAPTDREIAMNKPPAVAWEYRVVKVGPSASLVSEALLNELGQAGWELVVFQPLDQRSYPGEGAFYLKRPRREETP
jgi:hypothetical protein